MTTVTDRKTKRADELAAGDWVTGLAESLAGGNAQILTAYPYADDLGRTRVLLTYLETGFRSPQTARLDSTEQVLMVTAERLAEAREQAERAEKIADIRAFADFLEANPWAPLESLRMQWSPDPHGDVWNAGYRGIAELRKLAAQLGVSVDESCDDRMQAAREFGPVEYRLIAWHKDGRPAEPQRDDPTGLLYQRPADDPTPVSPARGELHTGAVTDDGLVEESDEAEARRTGGTFVQRYLSDPIGVGFDPSRDCLEQPDHEPHDGHTYRCCGKRGRISAHETWCKGSARMATADTACEAL